MIPDKSGTAIDGLRPNYLRRSGETTVPEVIQKLCHFVARLFLLPPNDVSPRIGGVICRQQVRPRLRRQSPTRSGCSSKKTTNCKPKWILASAPGMSLIDVSPQMRGIRIWRCVANSTTGIIPAQAGQVVSSTVSLASTQDLSPRMWGKYSKSDVLPAIAVPGIGWAGTSCEHDDKNPDF